MKKNNTRFIEIYNTFSIKEKEEFKEFISISLFNNGRKYKGFLDNLKLNSEGHVEMCCIQNNRTFYNRLSELTNLAVKFLTIKNLERNKFSSEMILLDELANRNIDNFYEQKFDALKKNVSGKSMSIEKINELYSINRLFLKNTSGLKNDVNKIDSYRSNSDLRFIQFISGNIDLMIQEYFIKQTKEPQTESHRELMFESMDIDLILNYVKSNIPEYYPVISFYSYIYKAFVELNDSYYMKARNILTDDFINISDEFKSKLLQYLIDYQIMTMNINKKAANDELFFLVNEKLNSGVFEEELRSATDNSAFINYVNNALALGKYEWVEDFINDYGNFLPAELRENGINLSNAFLSYYKKDFISCREYSGKVEKVNIYYYIFSSYLYIQASYELKKAEECYLVLKRLKEYLRTKNECDRFMVSFAQGFCNCFALLLKLNENPNRKNYMNLEYELNKKEKIELQWIKNKLAEINVA